MISLPIGDSTRRLFAAVKRLEHTLHSAGLPGFLACLPACWLCWDYCRILDQKTARIRHITSKFEQWRQTLCDFARLGPAQMELIDIDGSMHDDIEMTRATLWEFRSCCIDVGRMFDQLGHRSSRLKRRQAAFLQMLETSCMHASAMQDALAQNDRMVLDWLRSQQPV